MSVYIALTISLRIHYMSYNVQRERERERERESVCVSDIATIFCIFIFYHGFTDKYRFLRRHKVNILATRM